MVSARLEAGGVCVSFAFHLGLLKELSENKVKFKQTINLRKAKHWGRRAIGPELPRGEKQDGLRRWS